MIVFNRRSGGGGGCGASGSVCARGGTMCVVGGGAVEGWRRVAWVVMGWGEGRGGEGGCRCVR